MVRFLIFALVLASIAGCGLNLSFVYKPSIPVGGARQLPVKVAVLPFADGTGEYTQRDSSRGGYINLAKSGIDYWIGTVTPGQWGKAFADELTASGEFLDVRLISDISEGANDEVIVTGTVRNMDVPLPGSFEPVRFSVSMNARNGKIGQIFWEKSVSREDAAADGYNTGCGFDRQCGVNRRHAHYNDLLRTIFLEAKADFAKRIASSSGSQGIDLLSPGVPSSTLPSKKSVDETIEDILNDI